MPLYLQHEQLGRAVDALSRGGPLRFAGEAERALRATLGLLEKQDARDRCPTGREVVRALTQVARVIMAAETSVAEKVGEARALHRRHTDLATALAYLQRASRCCPPVALAMGRAVRRDQQEWTGASTIDR